MWVKLIVKQIITHFIKFQFSEEELLAMMTIKCLDTGQTVTMDKMEEILKGSLASIPPF